MPRATPALLATLALACAGERAAAPPPSPGAEVLRSEDLSRLRCLLLAPFENGSDAPLAGDAAAEGFGEAIDRSRATLLPPQDLRATLRGTPLELYGGAGPLVAIDLADLFAADAALSGAVEGRSAGAAPELVVSLRLTATADRSVLLAQTLVVHPAADEKPELAVRREVLAAARASLAALGNAAPRRCFEKDRLALVRSLALKRAPVAARPPPPGAPPPAPTLSPRQASWASRLGGGDRIVVEDVSFAGRTSGLERAAGLTDLAAALGALPGRAIRLEVFVDATSDAEGDQKLSRAMADAAVDRLVSLGVPRARLVAAGRGGEAPRVPNFTARGKATNRRVEAVTTR